MAGEHYDLDDPAEYRAWQNEMAERRPELRVTWDEWKRAKATSVPPHIATQKCCPRDNDGDGNCRVHARPGVRRDGAIEIFEALDPPEKADRDLVNALIDERATHLNLTAEICRLLYIDRTSTSNLEDDLEQIRDAAIEINHERYQRNIEKD